MVDTGMRLLIAQLMINCAKSGVNLPVLVVKKGKNNKPDKVVKAEIYCPSGLFDQAYSKNEYASSSSGIAWETFKFVNETLYYHNKKPLPSWYTNDDRNNYLTKYYEVLGCKTNKRTHDRKQMRFNVDQIHISETARILYGRGNAQL